MTEALTSPSQLELFNLDEFERVTPRDAWCHNGRWIKARHPALYDAVIMLLRERMPLLTIETLLKKEGHGISRHTIRGIRDNEPTLAHLQPTWLDDAREARARLAQRMRDEADVIDIDKAAFSLGVLASNITLAEGGATSRVAVTHDMSPELMELRKLCEGARTMGLEARKMPAMVEAAELGNEANLGSSKRILEAELVNQGGNEAPN